MCERDISANLLVCVEATLNSSKSGTMCDTCGTKINRLTRKTCSQCYQFFCVSCIQHTAPKGPYICSKCTVFTGPIMERALLKQLSVRDLKYYTKENSIETPLNVSHEQLVDIILGRQARVLTENARRALDQMDKSSQGGATFEDVLNVNVSRLEPQTSVYSSAGPGGSIYSETVIVGRTATVLTDGSLEQTDSAHSTKPLNTSPNSKDHDIHIRKKARKTIDITMVTTLEDLVSEEEINRLSVRQVKVILQRNCIDYKGCVEKDELLEKVKILWRAKEEEEKTEAKINETGDFDAESEFLCKICMDAPVNCVLLECGHMLTCVRCGRQLAECPVCRHYVSRVVHAFKV